MKIRSAFFTSAVLLLWLALLGGFAIVAAQGPAPAGIDSPAAFSNGCQIGSGYDAGCDVDHDGSINVSDVQRVAAHWNSSGAFAIDAWLLDGNSGTNPATQFLGTTDGQPLVFRTGNAERMRLDTNGRLGIGVSAPNDQLELSGNLRLSSVVTTTSGLIKQGNATLIHTYGSENFFAGSAAGNLSMAGGRNTAVGAGALGANTSGNTNTAIGYHALLTNTIGVGNTALGNLSLRTNISGTSNTALGNVSLFSNTSGTENTAAGDSALVSNLTGSTNTGLGVVALSANTNGSFNTAVGAYALSSNTIGNRNTAVGYYAGGFNSFANLVGSNNTYIGYNAAPGAFGPFTNATAIGYNATVSASNSLVLGGLGADAVKVGIGTAAPGTALHVVRSINSTATGNNHVALIDNSSTGNSADVLGLRIGTTADAVSSNNFISFLKGDDTSYGSIEGNSAGGVVFAGPGNDYAEWLPRLDKKEILEAGDIVGIIGGRVTRNTAKASRVMVLSRGPIVSGNDPGKDKRDGYVQVAFIGQVGARVWGPVQAGDLILPSGLGDGSGIAIAPDKITPAELGQVVGEAWTSAAETGLRTVQVAVGLVQHDTTIVRLVAANQELVRANWEQAARLAALEQQMTVLATSVARQEQRLAALERGK
ncbi:MAG: hypothetical protein EXR62_13630 [Chloroflexi bacterium]|nr:hypothetical protein [Chloroflexota bacterium]